MCYKKNKEKPKYHFFPILLSANDMETPALYTRHKLAKYTQKSLNHCANSPGLSIFPLRQ